MERMVLVNLGALVPKNLLVLLSALQYRTRVRQAEFAREAVADLIALYSAEEVPEVPPLRWARKRQMLHVGVPMEHRKGIQLLATRLRRTQKDLISEAIHRVLGKYGALP